LRVHVPYHNAIPIQTGLPFFAINSIPIYHSVPFSAITLYPSSIHSIIHFWKVEVSILFCLPKSSGSAIPLRLTMAPSSGGNATNQSMRTKLIVDIDRGTTYSGMLEISHAVSLSSRSSFRRRIQRVWDPESYGHQSKCVQKSECDGELMPFIGLARMAGGRTSSC
jgi:hypothetical protein